MTYSQNLIDDRTLDSLKTLLGSQFSLLIRTYIDDTNRRMNKLAKALRDKDYSTINQEAHALKGSSKNIGACTLAELYERIEHIGRQETTEGVEQLFATVKQHLAAVCVRLEGCV